MGREIMYKTIFTGGFLYMEKIGSSELLWIKVSRKGSSSFLSSSVVNCIEECTALSLEIWQVRPGRYDSEDVVYIAEPDHVSSRDVSVVVSPKGFHEQLGKDC